MAQRVQILLVCDLHDDETAGTETVTFAVEGASYEIDVCEAHGKQLREAFAPFVAAARRSSRSTGSGRRGRRGRGSAGGFDPAAVRAWAKDNGIVVSERGRISADVLDKYNASK